MKIAVHQIITRYGMGVATEYTVAIKPDGQVYTKKTIKLIAIDLDNLPF